MKAFLTLKEYFLKNRNAIILGFLSLLSVDLLQLIIPRIIKRVIDSIAGGMATPQALLRLALYIAAIGLFIGFFRFCWRYFILGTSRRIEEALRNRLFAHILTLSPDYFSATRTGDLMAKATNDVDAVRMCTGIGLVALADTIILGSSAIAFMLYISPRLTFVCVAPMLMIALLTSRFSRLIHRRFSQVQAAFATISEKVRETIAGIRVIKAYVREKTAAADFSKMSAHYINKNLQLVKIWGMFFPLIMVLSNLSIAMLIFFGGRFTIANQMTPGDIVAFANYLWILTWPMMALGWVVNIFQRGSASMIRINEVLETAPEIHDCPAAAVAPTIKGRIEIRNLTFAYNHGNSPVLKDISLSVVPGEIIGITGKTGAGKTTLCNLLLRFFTVAPGTIFIDGLEYHKIPIKTLRTSITYVPQDSFLFSESIQENISFGNPGASAADITQAARSARVYDEIMSFNDTFATVIGERGLTLSGGQKQRLCIARALLLKAPILILDDSFSSLDTSTSEEIITSLKTAAAGRTCIIVANRIASIKHAHKIFVFADGEITESGTHHELLAMGGLYYDLYRKQQLENEI